jgi:hypothetical protein
LKLSADFDQDYASMDDDSELDEDLNPAED